MMELDPYSDNYNTFELDYADYGFKKHETINTNLQSNTSAYFLLDRAEPDETDEHRALGQTQRAVWGPASYITPSDGLHANVVNLQEVFDYFLRVSSLFHELDANNPHGDQVAMQVRLENATIQLAASCPEIMAVGPSLHLYGPMIGPHEVYNPTLRTDTPQEQEQMRRYETRTKDGLHVWWTTNRDRPLEARDDPPWPRIPIDTLYSRAAIEQLPPPMAPPQQVVDPIGTQATGRLNDLANRGLISAISYEPMEPLAPFHCTVSCNILHPSPDGIVPVGPVNIHVIGLPSKQRTKRAARVLLFIGIAPMLQHLPESAADEAVLALAGLSSHDINNH